MNGFIIKTTCEDETAPGDQVAERWIGIMETADRPGPESDWWVER